jgi:hypothetical protein
MTALELQSSEPDFGTMNYSWSAGNEDSVSSFYHMTFPKHCQIHTVLNGRDLFTQMILSKELIGFMKTKQASSMEQLYNDLKK